MGPNGVRRGWRKAGRSSSTSFFSLVPTRTPNRYLFESPRLLNFCSTLTNRRTANSAIDMVAPKVRAVVAGGAVHWVAPDPSCDISFPLHPAPPQPSSPSRPACCCWPGRVARPTRRLRQRTQRRSPKRSPRPCVPSSLRLGGRRWCDLASATSRTMRRADNGRASATSIPHVGKAAWPNTPTKRQ